VGRVSRARDGTRPSARAHRRPATAASCVRDSGTAVPDNAGRETGRYAAQFRRWRGAHLRQQFLVGIGQEAAAVQRKLGIFRWWQFGGALKHASQLLRQPVHRAQDIAMARQRSRSSCRRFKSTPCSTDSGASAGAWFARTVRSGMRSTPSGRSARVVKMRSAISSSSSASHVGRDRWSGRRR
jgi:hypothetical protein